MEAFQEAVPAEVEAALRAAKVEAQSVRMRVSTDLLEDGSFGQQWVVVTDRRVLVVPAAGTDGSQEVGFDDLKEVRSENAVGAGRLTFERKHGAPLVVSYSNSLVGKFAEVAEGVRRLSKGEVLSLPEHVERTRCPKCGRLLPEKDGVCAACLRKWDTMVRIAGYLRPYPARVAVLVALSVVSPLVGLIPPLIVRHVIDDVLTPRTHVPLLGWLVLGLLAVQVVTWGLGMVSGWMRAFLSSRTSRDIRAQLFRHVQHMPLRFFDKRPAGTLISRFLNDSDRLEMVLLFGIPELLTNALMLVGILGLLFYMNWRLSLLVLLPVPPIALGSYLIWGRLRRYWVKWSARWSRLSIHLNESITGIRVVKAFAQESREAVRFDTRNDGLRQVSAEVEQVWTVFFSVMNFLMSFGAFFVWYFGGKQILSGTMTLGVLTAFISYLWQLYRPLTFMSQLNNFLSRAFAGAEQIFQILDQHAEVADEKDAVAMPQMEGRVRFQDVSFEYERGKPVLQEIDLEVAPGEMVGLVGRSGVGKSTLIRLICRFYEVDRGRIEIDGVDLRKIRLEDLRRHIGMVQQEPFLFSGTVAENIGYARPGAGLDEIVRAARAAEAHEFIVRKPDGYNTLVGERGNKLSGGEKQRIAIARALLHDPKILILDEATSSLDTQTEKKIQAAIGRLVAGRTTFAIAHRLSTLRLANRLVVLDGGKVAEVGTHAELMEKEGIFYRLVKTQQETSSVVAVGGGKDDVTRQ